MRRLILIWLFAGLLAAGLDGITNHMQPDGYCDVDPASLSQAERDAKGIQLLPRTLSQAVDAFEADSLFQQVFGDKLVDAYAKIKARGRSVLCQIGIGKNCCLASRIVLNYFDMIVVMKAGSDHVV